MFGVSPKKAAETDCYVAAVTKPSFDFTMRNMESIPYTIKPLPALSITGVRGVSPACGTPCAARAYGGSMKRRARRGGLPRSHATERYTPPMRTTTAATCCAISACGPARTRRNLLQTTVAAGLWVLFDAQSGFSEQQINDLYAKILFAWLPSGRTRYDGTRPNVEIFSDDGTDAFTIMIPVAGVEESGER